MDNDDKSLTDYDALSPCCRAFPIGIMLALKAAAFIGVTLAITTVILAARNRVDIPGPYLVAFIKAFVAALLMISVYRRTPQPLLPYILITGYMTILETILVILSAFSPTSDNDIMYVRDLFYPGISGLGDKQTVALCFIAIQVPIILVNSLCLAAVCRAFVIFKRGYGPLMRDYNEEEWMMAGHVAIMGAW